MSATTTDTLLAIVGLVLSLVGIYFAYKSQTREQARQRQAELDAAEERGAARYRDEMESLRDDLTQAQQDKRDLRLKIDSLEAELRRHNR